MNVTQLIGKFHGITEFGRVIGARPQAVWNMKSRGSIPAEYWPALVRAAAERKIDGVTLESLSALAAKRRPSRAHPQPAA